MIKTYGKDGHPVEMSTEGLTFSANGACAALVALRNAAADTAFIKAATGCYRPAADILSAVFPRACLVAAARLERAPWADGAAICELAEAVTKTKPPRHGFTSKQMAARRLAEDLLRLPALQAVEAR